MGFKISVLACFVCFLYAYATTPLPQETTPHIAAQTSQAPQSISLEACIQSARQHYPLHQNKQLLDESLKLELQRLHLTYLPRIKFSSKASYQSDVTTLPFNSQTLSSIPPLANALSDYRPQNKDQYNFHIEISQPIIDSLNVWANKAILSKQYALAKSNIDKELYKVQQSIINAYFSALLIDKQIAQLQIHKKELQKNHSYMQKRHKNGVGLQSDVDKLQIEIFNANKILKSLQAQHSTALAILTELSGLNLHNTKLEIPNKAQSLSYLQTTLARLQEDSNSLFQNRPEIDFFALKQDEAHLQKRLELSKSMPYIDAFFQGGYANPGLNILRNGFKDYYIVGLRLNWDISNLYSKSQQDEIIARNKLQINSQKQEFLLQARLQLIENSQNAQSLLSQLEESRRIIALQEKILSQSKSQLQNGILSTNDFISDINKLHLLKLEHNYQEIEVLMEIFKIRQNLNEWETLYKDL